MSPRAARLRRAAPALGHLLVAVVATAPLAWRGGQLPLGREPVATVPQFNLWTLRWTADRLPHGLSGWWDAPIFWPHRGTFAFSEPQPLTGAAFAAVRLVTGDVRGYAVVLIATIALNGIAGAALARRLGAAAPVAFAAGVLAQTLPFAFDQLGLLQLLALWPMLALLACALAWIDEPRPRHGVLAGLSFAAAVGTCGYYALLLAVCLVVAAPAAADRSWRPAWRRRTAGVLVAGGVAALLALPLIIGQQQHLGDRRWLDRTILAGSASMDDWLPGGRLWPGLPLVALAMAGAWIGRARPTTRLLGTVMAVALLASLGTRLTIFGLRPWQALVDHVDAIARLRSPFRAAAIVEVALVGLAVPALQSLWTSSNRWVRATVPAVVAASVLVSGVGPGRLVDAPPPPGAWATHLATTDRAGDPAGDRAVVFLPFAPGSSAADFEATTTRMVQALPTGHPMLGGYSGFFPRDHRTVAAALRGWPDARSTDLLQRRSVGYVVIDDASFDRLDRRLATAAGYRVLAHDRDAWLLQVPTP